MRALIFQSNAAAMSEKRAESSQVKELWNIFAYKKWKMDNIIGIGNALVDVLAHIPDDSVLSSLGLAKGSMQLIDARRYHEISTGIAALNPSRATGGSAANAILALARLGRKPGLIGKIGNDANGRFYAATFADAGVNAIFSHSDMPTGVASTFVSPDGQRTFATHLGAAATLEPIDINREALKPYKYLYLEGYLVQNHALIEHAVELAKELGMKVCLDMASYNIVEQDHSFFKKIISESIDIVFANEEEAHAFTGLTPEESLDAIAAMCDTVIVKLGARGSISRSRALKCEHAECQAQHVENVTDTTAAGDFFTAGFMYAFTAGCPLGVCLQAGTALSSAVIQVTGTALPSATWDSLRKQVRKLCKE